MADRDDDFDPADAELPGAKENDRTRTADADHKDEPTELQDGGE
jgi:hypothetical protein